MKHISISLRTLVLACAAALFAWDAFGAESGAVTYHNVKVDDVNIFYREAGDPKHPTVVLLHGFPSSSHMFRNLIPKLATNYHVIAADYPGYGYSDQPPAASFGYTFDHLAAVVDDLLTKLGTDRYSIYIQDYGAPVGFRLFLKHPDRIQAIISQNGNAYNEGLAPFWNEYIVPYWKEKNPTTEAKARGLLALDSTRLQYSSGYHDLSRISPDAWLSDQATLDKPGNHEIQLALFYDYQTNVKQYDLWHEALRKYHPPVLAVWGKNDPIFAAPGAEAFKRDVPDAEVHLLDTGHFALEEEGDQIAAYILEFLGRKLK
jgi:pimeloyl-ACP methyl ester carboxylesterase